MTITDNAPLAIMTVGQLFGVGLNTAQKYKDEILKDAVMQHGRKIIVDVDKAMELYQQHCTNK